jgi:hypothetical protein
MDFFVFIGHKDFIDFVWKEGPQGAINELLVIH